MIARILKLAAAAALSIGIAGIPTAFGQDNELPSVRILNSFTFVSMDPAKGSNWLTEFGSAEALTKPVDDGTIEPWLLKSFERVDDTTWRLILRDGITFQNGKPLTAEAAVAALKRQAELNAAAKTQLGTVTFEATGDLEITLVTQEPDAVVPWKLAEYRSFPIYDVSAVEAAAGDEAAIIGSGLFTGPYAPVAFSTERVELQRYAGYWGGAPALKSVVADVVGDAQTRIAAIQSGEADIALYPSTETKRALEGRDDAYFITARVGKESLQLAMNQKAGVFQDRDVRRAFGLSVDYRSIAEDVLDGLYDVAEGLYPQSQPGALANQHTDVEAAKALLDADGWTVGADGIREKDGQRLHLVLLTYPQQPDTTSVAVAIQSQLSEIGFEIEILSAEDINASMKEVDSWNASLIFNGTVSPFSNTPNLALYNYFQTGTANNYSGISDSELDGLIAQVNVTFDEKAQQDILKRIQTIVIEEQGYMFIAAFKAFPMVVGPAWNGYDPSLFRRWIAYDTAPVRAE